MQNGYSSKQTISGNVSAGFVIGGHSYGNNAFNQYNTFNQTDEPFTQVDIESMVFLDYDEKLLKRLTKKLKEKRSIIIHGDFDSVTFARHLAAYVHAWAKKSNFNFKVFEVDKISLDILRKIDRSQDLGIYIIPNLAPSQINYELADLIKRRRNAFIITTSKEPMNIWRCSKHEEDNFLKIAKEEIYTNGFLKSYLNYELSILHDDGLRIGHLLTDAIKDKIITRLKSDWHISVIVKRIVALNKNEINIDTISTIIEDVTKNDQEDKVYKLLRSYQEREKILILALTLFDGLAEEQFLEVLELLFETSWGKYFNLYRYDAKDLDLVRGFVNITTIRGYERKLQCKFPKKAVLEAFYLLYPLHIKRAIPVLSDILLEKVSKEFASIYSIPYRKSKLEQTIISTFSEIGLISLRKIIYPIAQLLLSEKSIEHASRVVLNWYIDETNRSCLFKYLDSMINENTSNYSTILLSVDENDRSKIRNNVKKHFLKTISLLSTYYKQNNLEGRIILLLNKFIEKHGEEIGDKFYEECISVIFNHHPEQIYIHFIDKKFTKNKMAFISKLLQIKYESDPEAGWNILERIFNYVDKSQYIDTIETLVLLNVYSKIVRKNSAYSNHIDLIGTRCLDFLDEQTARETRRHILIVCQNIIARDPWYIPEILPKISSDEKEEIIAFLLDIAKEQRSELHDKQVGDISAEIEGRRYYYFLPRHYILPIEKDFQLLILGGIDALSKQFSLDFLFQTHVMLVDLDYRIRDKCFERVEKNNTDLSNRYDNERFDFGDVDQIEILEPESLSWFDREIICRFVTFRHPKYRKVIVYLAPKALLIHQKTPGDLNELLSRWQRPHRSSDLAAISILLQKAIKYLLNKGYILFFLALMLVTLACIAISILILLF